MLAVAVLLIVIGVLSLVARDFLWELTRSSNRIRGVASERTETWEAWTIISGLVMLVVGVLMAINGYSTAQEVQRSAVPPPYPGSVLYKPGSVPEIDQAIDEQWPGITYYRVPITGSASATRIATTSYYMNNHSIEATQCLGYGPPGAKGAYSIECSGDEQVLRVDTVELPGRNEILVIVEGG